MLVSTARHAPSGDQGNPSSSDEFLRLTIVVCSSVSLVGLVFSFLRHSMFSTPRQLSSVGLMNLLAALLLTQLLFVIGHSGVQTAAGCRVASVLLHNCHLAAFCWLLLLLSQACQRCRHCISLSGGGTVTDSAANIARHCAAGWGVPLVSAALQAGLPAGPAPAVTQPSPLGCWSAAGRPRQLVTFSGPALVLALAALALLVRCTVLVRHAVAMQVVGRARRRLRRDCYRQLLLHGRLLLLLTLAAVSATVAAGDGRQMARTLHALLQALLGLAATLCLGWRLLRLQGDSWRRPWQAASYSAVMSARSSSAEALTLNAPEVI